MGVTATAATFAPFRKLTKSVVPRTSRTSPLKCWSCEHQFSSRTERECADKRSERSRQISGTCKCALAPSLLGSGPATLWLQYLFSRQWPRTKTRQSGVERTCTAQLPHFKARAICRAIVKCCARSLRSNARSDRRLLGIRNYPLIAVITFRL